MYLFLKTEFFASLLQSHDPSEIILIFWFAAQKTWTESSEEQYLSEIEILCNII